MSETTSTAVAHGSAARSLRGRCRLSAVVVAVCLAGAAGAAPAGMGPAPAPKPGRVMSSPYPQSVGVAPEAAVEAEDGSVVVVGWFGASWSDYEVYRESSLALGRLRPDGRVDASFGDGGEVRDARFRAAIGGVALDGAGRIVVAGWEGRVPVVARYGPNGTPDGTFGEGGIARGRPERPGDSAPTTLAARALADGSVIVVSNVHQPFLTGEPAPGGLSVTRLRVDGAPLFRKTHSAPEWAIRGERAYATWSEASIQADGSVVVVGHVADPAPYRRGCNSCDVGALFVMRRFAPDGTVDRAFGTAGRTMIQIGESAYAADVQVARDGVIVVGGVEGQGGRNSMVARFGANGRLDRSFGEGGVFTLLVEPSTSGTQRVVLAPDGGVVLAGGPGLTLVRVDRDGRIVPSFGVGGRASVDGVGSFRDVLPGTDGSLRILTTTTDRQLRLVELDVTGRATGETIAELPMSVPSRGAHAGVALRRGGVVLAGWIDTGSGIAPHLVRTGSPSASRFGSKARVTLALGTRAEATAIAEWRDGSLLAAGAVAAERGDRWFVGKLTSKGDLDARFGANGIAMPLAPAPDSAVVSAVALADGRSLVLGRSDDAVLLVRLLRNGARDDTFGRSGIVELPLDSGVGLVVDRAGRSVVGGIARGALAALAIDLTGRAGAPLVGPAAVRAAGVAVEPDGAVVVAGTAADGLVLARWTSAGTLERGFGPNADGVVRRTGYDAAGTVVQRDGRTVVAARERATGRACLLRFVFGGEVDGSFGTDGVACAPSRAVPAGVAVAPDVLYLAGTAETAGGTDLALTSFEQVPLMQPVARGVSIERISRSGDSEPLITTATHPVLSPDGRWIAYVGDSEGAPELFVADAGGGQRRRVTQTPFEDGSVLSGTAPVWSRDGRLLAFATLDSDGIPQISVVARDGRGLRTVTRGVGPSWGSGRQLAYSVDGAARIVDVDSGESRGLGQTGGWPQWSPRGDLILLGRTLVRPDGTTVGDVNLFWTSWKPDGTALVGLDGRRIVAVDVARLRRRTILTGGVDMRSPTWSRDGRWIAYIRYVGVYQLVIVDARTGRRVLAWRTPGRTFAGTVPSWSRVGVHVGVS